MKKFLKLYSIGPYEMLFFKEFNFVLGKKKVKK